MKRFGDTAASQTDHSSYGDTRYVRASDVTETPFILLTANMAKTDDGTKAFLHVLFTSPPLGVLDSKQDPLTSEQEYTISSTGFAMVGAVEDLVQEQHSKRDVFPLGNVAIVPVAYKLGGRTHHELRDLDDWRAEQQEADQIDLTPDPIMEDVATIYTPPKSHLQAPTQAPTGKAPKASQ